MLAITCCPYASAKVRLQVPRHLAPTRSDTYNQANNGCWGPSSSEGPQKRNLTVSSKHGLYAGTFGFRIKGIYDEGHGRDEG
jgi:hypothetical protein